jgi:uncharacterized protein YgbK (DUF1537 family)
MRGVPRIVADDLTGALDAAAPFATPGRRVTLPWRSRRVSTDEPVAISSESRNLGRTEAVVETLRAFEEVRADGPALRFKKVDSMLRGHPVAEIAALMREHGFRRCVFAPAFPEMGRLTRGGRQFVVGPEGEHAVGPADLRRAFEEEGLTAALAGSPAAGTAAVVVVDAVAPEDLVTAARDLRAEDGTLWAGSRGLAAALAGSSEQQSVPPIGFVIVGTAHPATRAQAREIGLVCASVGPHDVAPQGTAQPLLINPVPQTSDAAETRRVLLEMLSQPALWTSRSGGVLVVGGDTLSTLLDAVAAGGLQILGEVGPGIPLSQICGGMLDGRYLVSKSGGFGAPGLLLDLLSDTFPN